MAADSSESDGEPADTDGSETSRADAPDAGSVRRLRHIRCGRAIAYGVIPALVLAMAVGAGDLKWMNWSARQSQLAETESVRAATDSTVALLSYDADTVDKDLATARQRLTGKFKDSYTALTNDVVIPGSKEKQVSSVANVPAAALVSASADHAVVLVFVNQTVTVGANPPAHTATSVRVTLDKVGDRWLISQYDPL